MLILYYNCFEGYKKVKGFYDLDQLDRAFRKNKLKVNKKIGIEIDKTSISQDTVINCGKSSTIRLNFVKNRYNNEAVDKIVGVISQIDTIKQEILLNKCIAY